jgi:hypothetical protein
MVYIKKITFFILLALLLVSVLAQNETADEGQGSDVSEESGGPNLGGPTTAGPEPGTGSSKSNKWSNGLKTIMESLKEEFKKKLMEKFEDIMKGKNSAAASSSSGGGRTGDSTPPPTPTLPSGAEASDQPTSSGQRSESGTGSGSSSSIKMSDVQSKKYIVINKNVYDLSSFKHPGGDNKITPLFGKDGSAAFSKQHDPSYLDKIQNYLKGTLN